MINARPHINGNTRADFGDAFHALTDAVKAVHAARAELMNCVLNGRNYQHLPSSDAVDALHADRNRAFAELLKVDELLEALATDVADAANEK